MTGEWSYGNMGLMALLADDCGRITDAHSRLVARRRWDLSRLSSRLDRAAQEAAEQRSIASRPLRAGGAAHVAFWARCADSSIENVQRSKRRGSGFVR